MRSAFQHDERQIPMATSIGIACWSEGMDVHALIACADAAMYKAKRAGRNNYQLYCAGDEDTVTLVA